MTEPLQTTLVIAHTDTHVLLGMKKRGFGEGRWNGFGGKLKPGEDIETAARRELHQECGLTARELSNEGFLSFRFVDPNEQPIDMHIFRVREWEGEPYETEEMRPQWFSHEEIPFDDMWPDDRFWLPKFLKGAGIEGVCHFKDFDTIIQQDIRER